MQASAWRPICSTIFTVSPAGRDIGDDDVSPVLSKPLRERLPDAVRSARDNCNFVVVGFGHAASLLVSYRLLAALPTHARPRQLARKIGYRILSDRIVRSGAASTPMRRMRSGCCARRRREGQSRRRRIPHPRPAAKRDQIDEVRRQGRNRASKPLPQCGEPCRDWVLCHE